MHATIAVEVVSRRPEIDRVPALPREDIYGTAHKGLRWLLCQVMVAMGRTDFASAESAARILTELDHVLAACSAHLAHENAHVHAALDRRRPGSSARLGGEHQHHEYAIAELRRHAADVAGATPQTRVAFGRRLYLRYSAFVGENLIHMVDEEELAQAVLEEIYSTEELQHLHRTLVQSIPPAEMLPYLRIMLAGVDPVERANLVAGAGKVFPIDQVATLVATLRPEIGDREWQELASAFLRSI